MTVESKVMGPDLVVIYEHPEWQKPLFSALAKRSVRFDTFDLKGASFDVDAVPETGLYFNQASPSAYVRGNTRAVPLAHALIRSLEIRGARVLNGSRAFGLELSKSAQGSLLRQLGVDHPKTLAFNDVQAALKVWDTWPALLKPEQGGSGARMFELSGPDDLVNLLDRQPELWLPDNLLLLQEKFEVDASRGIVRMEFLGGELLYAMRVVSHGAFNLCPSEVCNPLDGPPAHDSASVKPVEFFAYHDVPPSAVEAGKSIIAAGGLDVGGIEYLEAPDGRLVFYDVNANSNLRPAIAQEFGFDPFDRVVDFLAGFILADSTKRKALVAVRS